ncbi:MAG: hypothetical protein M0R77_19940 [Gammaproteobacteria bacterium]|nr:hypothetical protein [Gammaproteobacteria bacterium]
MALPGSILARQALNNLGLNCYKLYTQRIVHGRTYKIYGQYKPYDLGRLQQELAALGAMNVRPVHDKWRGVNAGVRFEY